ncbi:MAG: Tryptophan--tRNA ligase [Microgenomates bacterium OLB23]|nr:MAG: Tryptophan--tRNA ligase [Microgenomates bacterium OLB23]
MTTDEKIQLIEQVGEEITTTDDLRALLESGKPLIAYDGFEPSGQIHIAQGILRAININKMIKAGFTFKMLVADWHAYLNNKLGGDINKIQTTGKYFIEVWRACGMDLDHVEFIWSSDMVHKPDYWELVMKVSTHVSLNRVLRTTQIMGRDDKDALTAAQILYPIMQTADIFTLGAHATQLGMDQRKVNMLARQIGEEVGYYKPVVISNHMLLGLDKPASDITDTKERAIALKMSKSKPDTAIFMTDTQEDIERKITKAWCPEGIVDENPILEYCKYILFEKFPSLTINRPEKFGGAITFTSYTELEQAFVHKDVHPMDLKMTVIALLDQLLEPVRRHFKENAEAKALLEEVTSYKVTR